MKRNARFCAVLEICLAAALVLCGSIVRADAQQKTSTGTSVASKDFPDGTATPSEVCGACHKAIYQEFSAGMGSDLHWRGMKLVSLTDKALAFPKGAPLSATAHSVAGTDPFPIEARRVEENGKQCNICHYPQPLEYPDENAAKIEKPTPREANREAGLTCASCHLTPDGKIRGPYDIKDAPHATVKDARVQTSVACAFCHAEGERVIGKQTQTFFEWREDFNKADLGPQQCQDCHMPKTVRKLAEDFDVSPRVSGRHVWTGGHSFQRVSGALALAITQPEKAKPGLALHVTNVGAGHSVPTGSNRRAIYLKAEVVGSDSKVLASKEWMFAPWMLARPDDKKYVAEDLKGKDPVATSQADAQGPHETIIRAGEERILDWKPRLPKGRYTVRAALIYDLNRYNDRKFKDDQHEIAHAALPISVSAP